ncbi:hypothetical protein, variant 1 [Aphanomyces astaci]|uniref:RNase NYN domain-containing protein n=1 Tax=Aphanomyces astaci TaxID=112090 RepID=W4GRN6_APHAT|nr:hypothetical protein, variant 1 [Aphanomyces astaci]ETV81543.1 hypothetical protein, variant 1 [Aphanomyces astaci]|eukprot:XP_009829401.1 hypothetical protein, variant 1 [Aphanomyces astaci]
MATVVLDAANVATVSSGILRVQRLEAALEYFQRLNVRCIAFAPRYWVDGLQVFEDDATKSTLRALVDTDKLVLTPPQAHDDYYVIDYATKHDGYVVSNDMFRDHVMHKRRFNGHTLTIAWVKTRCIDFTFVGLEFLPNSQVMDKVLHHVPRPPPPLPTSLASAAAPDHHQSSTSFTSGIQPVAIAPVAMSYDDDDVDMGGSHHHDSPPASNSRRVVDMSEAVYIDVPMWIVAHLYENDGAGLKYFQELTGTYMQLPRVVPLGKPTTTLSIHGSRDKCERAMHEVHSYLQHQQHMQSHHPPPQPQYPPQHQQHQQQQQQQYYY